MQQARATCPPGPVCADLERNLIVSDNAVCDFSVLLIRVMFCFI